MPFYNSEEERQHGLHQLQQRQVGPIYQMIAGLTHGCRETAQEKGCTELRSLNSNLCESKDFVLCLYVPNTIQSLVFHVITNYLLYSFLGLL